LAGTLIQSNLVHSTYTLFLGSRTHNLGTASALLYQLT